MYSCLYNSTANTLIVLDEFGKGTADTDGLALLSSCLRDFLERKESCPHILISTHFHTLANLLPTSPLIKSQVRNLIKLKSPEGHSPKKSETEEIAYFLYH